MIFNFYKADLQAESILLREREELERRDHELALRLAAESNSSLDENSVLNI